MRSNPLCFRAALTLFAACLLAIGLCRATRANELPLLVNEDFEKDAARWQPADPRAWKLLKTPQGQVYSLFQQSQYQPPHRSPVNIALLKDVIVDNFVFEARVQSTVKDYDHRSLVLVFGYQDPAHYYYVHFGKKTDDHANQVFIVNGAPRIKISRETNFGTPWDDAWHQIKIVRNVDDGETEIYFDDMNDTAMLAFDKTFTWGQVGIGSFDDLGNFDNVSLRGTVVPPSARSPKP